VNKQNQETSVQVLKRSLLTGFAGGIFWSLIGSVLAYFKFMEFTPKALLVRSWLRTSWSGKWPGDLLALILAGLLSILVAVIYFVLFRKLASMWIGAVYGIIIWGVVFFLVLPLIKHLPSIAQLNKQSIITTLCLYLLYGVFVGFSISYDYKDTIMNSKMKRKL